MTFGLLTIQPTASDAAASPVVFGWAGAEQRRRHQIRQPLQGVAQSLSQQEVILLPSGAEVDIRRSYVSDGFEPKGIDPEVLLGDMAFLCESSELAPGGAGAAARHAITPLADRAVPFGGLEPDAQQVFEGFSITGDSCIWEAF